MNLRLQKYKANRIAGMGIEDAAVAAGWSKSYSRSKAWRIEKKANVSLCEAFGRAGLTDEKIIQHALEGLKADKVISCNIVASDGEGMKDANSMTKDFVDVPDWTARHKYFETILKVTNRLKDKVEHSGKVGGGTTVNVYPNKTIVFQDLGDDSKADTVRLHESQSSEGSRSEVAL